MISRATHIHFIGIGGIGMSGLAKLVVAQGCMVSGSDLNKSPMTLDLERRGLRIHIGHDVAHIDPKTDLVVYSSAIPASNVERMWAREHGIPEQSYAQALGEFSKGFSTIVVTGTHGKSTTTAMIGLILEAAGYDPTVLVGSLVPSFPDGNVRVGKSRFFVVEGCEYQANMLNLHPESIVLTNIELDHPDFYRDLDHVRETFKQFIDRLSGNGLVVLNADDPESRKLITDRSVTFGCHENAHYRLAGTNVHRKEDGGEAIGSINLRIPGSFNRQNALAAIATAMELGVPFETCQQVVESFRGIWRRFEFVGTFNGADIVSDYGHHPTAIVATVQAAKEFCPDRRVVLCYQPHQHARTKKLFNEFVEVFSALNVPTILVEIYDVAGRNEDHEISSNDLVKAVDREDVVFAKDLAEADLLIRNMIQPNDLVIIMGAGDIDDLARALSKK